MDVLTTVGEASVWVTKSQIAFRRRKGFAYVWRPGQYLNSPCPRTRQLASSQVPERHHREVTVRRLGCTGVRDSLVIRLVALGIR